MADQPPTYIHPDYANTPVVSPTASITFSDTASMGHQHHLEAPVHMNVFPAAQNPYASDQRWYPHEYPLATTPNHPHQQPSYENVASNTLPVTSTVHVPSGNMTAAAAHNWVQIIPPVPMQVPFPVHSQASRIPTSLLQPPQQWQHPIAHRHPQQPESLEQSRQNSISSTSVAGSMSTTPTAVDDLNDYGSLDSRPTPSPIHERPPFKQRLMNDRQSIRMPPAEIVSTDDEPTSPHHDLVTVQVAHQQYRSSQLPQQVPQTATSPASSLLDSESQQTSPTTLGQPPVKRKRGRPPNKDKGDANKTKTQRISRRQPHNQVERKYREGLNHEMEKLRRSIPQLPQGPVAGQKASKAQVLQGAVQEIERLREEKEEIERERDQFKQEVERLKNKKNSVLIGRAVETN